MTGTLTEKAARLPSGDTEISATPFAFSMRSGVQAVGLESAALDDALAARERPSVAAATRIRIEFIAHSMQQMVVVENCVSLAQLTRLGRLFNELTSIDHQKSDRLPPVCTSGFQPDRMTLSRRVRYLCHCPTRPPCVPA